MQQIAAILKSLTYSQRQQQHSKEIYNVSLHNENHHKPVFTINLKPSAQ